MSSKLQHKLLNLEITPPQGSWSSIATRLNGEYDVHETALADKLTGWQIAPPATAWECIASGLAEESPIEKENSPVVFSFRKLAVAAAITGLLVVAGWYFFSGSAPVTTTVQAESATETQLQPPVTGNDASPALTATQVIPGKPLPARSKRQLADLFHPVSTNLANNYQLVSFIPHAEEDVVHAIPTTTAPNVAAPLIRDASGRVILDRGLITSADNNYIIVTAPNGEQTRISSRFMQMLGSMNEEIKPSDYYDYFFLGENNSEWKIRFNEWRNKLLRQASFIPTATNFLDILELKDMLQDN